MMKWKKYRKTYFSASLSYPLHMNMCNSVWVDQEKSGGSWKGNLVILCYLKLHQKVDSVAIASDSCLFSN